MLRAGRRCNRSLWNIRAVVFLSVRNVAGYLKGFCVGSAVVSAVHGVFPMRVPPESSWRSRCKSI